MVSGENKNESKKANFEKKRKMKTEDTCLPLLRITQRAVHA